MRAELQIRLCGVILGVFVALAAGCGSQVKTGHSTPTGQPAETWDLRTSHSSRQVNWPAAAGSAFERTNLRVRVLFPEGRVFTDPVQRVTSLRFDDMLSSLDFYFPATSTDKAYALAKRLGSEWQINLSAIDAWYQRRTRQRSAGGEDFSDTALTGGPASRPLGGPAGPAPTIEVLNSFDTQRPVVVNLSFFWPR